MPAAIRHPLLTTALAGLAAIATGCAGSVVVDYALSARVLGHDETGRAWEAQPHDIVTIPRHPDSASPFAAVKFRGEAFEWTFGIGSLGLGSAVTNRLATPLCFRFDEARLSSNFHPDEVPMRVARMRHNVSGKWVILGDRTDENYFVPPPLCLAPEKSAQFSLSPQLSGLFPTRRMFNVQWPDGEPSLTDQGIGNWLKVVLPIEHDGKREMLQVTLTATDSRARKSFY